MATIEGGQQSMLSTEQTAEMERAIAALALELPAEVWEDVRDRWHAARDSLGHRIEKLEESKAALVTEVKRLQDRVTVLSPGWRP